MELHCGREIIQARSPRQHRSGPEHGGAAHIPPRSPRSKENEQGALGRSGDAFDRYADSFDGATHAVLLDIDGTLLDFAPSPAGVKVPAELRRTLTALLKWTGGALALISGRPLQDIDRTFAPLKLPAVGGHGAELRPKVPRGKVVRRASPLLDERIRRRLLNLAARHVLIEDKGYSIALHYRLAPELGPELTEAVAAIVAGFPDGRYEALPGQFVIEVKPKTFNKGSAVLELMELSPFRGKIPIFIGDDVTDEAVFAILPDIKGVGFSVGRMIPGVTGIFDRPADVRHWLSRIASRAA